VRPEDTAGILGRRAAPRDAADGGSTAPHRGASRCRAARRRVPLGVDGLFEVVVRIPRALAGRRLHVTVDLHVGGSPRREAEVSSQTA
jgi:hypothetical protein